MSKKNLVPKMSGSKKYLVQNASAPKIFWVLRNSEYREIWAPKIWLKMDPSFKIIAQRFLIKTNFGKTFGPERFGSKDVVVSSMLKLSNIISGR